ncbi:MAG TPA: phosphatase PAP2 family protein [Thermoanaerobaculia bacterium]|nr:phosphatase PAP2 family protein [Thermoanaerobaculia bacterium]
MSRLLLIVACFSTMTAAHAETRTLARGPLDHYRRLAALSGAPRGEPHGIDRQQFSLAAMSAGYLKVIDVKPTYLDLPPTAFPLPEFPANSSRQTRAELDHLLELQARRTPEEIEYSQQLAGVYYRLSVRPGDADWPRMRQNLFHMGHQLGAWFGPDSLPVTADFMARVWSDASYYLWAAKFRFNRVRPYTIEPRLQNLETPNFPAYPSGHSSNSWVAAYVYELLLPEQRDLFMQNARDMAYSREILGVHYASDSESGRVFARQFVDRLKQEPAFRKDLEAARQEIQKVMAASAR